MPRDAWSTDDAAPNDAENTPMDSSAVLLDADPELPPAPNDRDPGDGTRATGGTIVYDDRAGNTPGSQTGCRMGAFPNQWTVVIDSFGGDFGLERPLVMISFPLDRLTRSRVFDVGPRPSTDSWVGLDRASIFFALGSEVPQFGGSGTVWVRIVDRVMEVRFEGIPLVDDRGVSMGHTLGAAYLCWDPLP